MDTAGEGDGDRADEVSRDRWLHQGRERILLRAGWEAVQALKADRVAPEKDDLLHPCRHKQESNASRT